MKKIVVGLSILYGLFLGFYLIPQKGFTTVSLITIAFVIVALAFLIGGRPINDYPIAIVKSIIPSIYVLLNILISWIFIAFFGDKLKGAIIVEALTFFVFFMAWIEINAPLNKMAKMSRQSSAEINWQRTVREMMQASVNGIDDVQLRQKAYKVIDNLTSTYSVSREVSHDIEQQILCDVSSLSIAVSAKDSEGIDYALSEIDRHIGERANILAGM